MSRRFRRILAVALGTALGCTTAARTGDGGIQPSSGGAPSTGAGPGTSSGGTNSSGTGRATSSSTGGGTVGSSSSGGSSTGGTTGSAFGDGGYAFCSLPSVADAGPNGTPGTAAWMCRPGTYFCDLGGDIGSCFQCRTDADCSDQRLPTYDPNRLHCDLDSGVPGYQNFCQQCTANADCVASLVGSFCELSTVDPPSALEPSIELEGFETCYPTITDCRQVGGPVCREFNQTCNPSNGHCENLPTTCATDQDCAGIFWAISGSNPNGSPYLPQPFCVNGACNPCDGGACPNDDACQSDADCGNPGSSPLGPSCDPVSARCVCTSSAQCSGFWPACLGLDAGNVNGAGEPIGVCSCENDAQCGDGGLVCLPPTFLDTYPYAMPALIQNIYGSQAGDSFCGVPCSSPDFPACNALTGLSVCDVSNGLCTYCYDDEQCQSSFGSTGPYCSGQFIQAPLPPGTCGCILDADCPYGQNCRSMGGIIGSCMPSLPHCTPAACDGYFCNWDSGVCVDEVDSTSYANCISDFDCGDQVDFCVQGQCVQCRDDADCAVSGRTEQTHCCGNGSDCAGHGVVDNTCVDGCHADQDCAGNSAGPSCLVASGTCGCGSDSDCAGRLSGHSCDTNPGDGSSFGSCVCRANADCTAGNRCFLSGSSSVGSCLSQCSADADCPLDFFCDPSFSCRARCDPGHACADPDPVCDGADIAGQNGQSAGSDAGGVMWCYACLSSADCDGGLGCSNDICQTCSKPTDCAPGAVCLADGLCHATCDAGACPGGAVCDTLDQAGNGRDVCYACVSPIDCPDGEGCDSQSHTCGTCEGPSASGGPYDCPPDAICSNYWSPGEPGVCLTNCDRASCPADRPICAVFPPLTPDHAYCFGCTKDADCSAAGSGAWCDLSIHRTFTCQAGPI